MNFKSPKIAYFIIFVLFGYSLLLSASISYVITNPGLFFSNLEQRGSESFDVAIFFESKDLNNPVNWDPIVKTFNESVSLFFVLNSSVLLEGQFYGNLGFFINGINSISQYDSFYWQIFRLSSQNIWEYSAAGVSSLKIESDAYFRLIFSE